MKLYGIAIAAVPKKDNPNILTIMCNPISVADDDRYNFKLLDELKFTDTVDLTSADSVRNCFNRIVETIGAVVRRQKGSIGVNPPHRYRRVALTIGEDSRNPAPGNILFQQLFGEPPSPHLSEEELLLEECRIVAASYADYDGKPFDHISKVPAGIKRMVGLVKDGIVPFFAKKFAELRENNDKLAADIQRFEEIRKGDPGETPSEYFIGSCTSLSDLLEDCSLTWGSYTPEGGRTGGWETAEQTPFDLQLIDLKSRWASGDPEAFQEILEIAKEEGKKCGRAVNWDARHFGFPDPGKEYKDSQALQDKFPTEAFYHWDEDEAFIEAFHEGFAETHEGEYSRRYKLPLDPLNPPFVDPTADMIRAEFEILEGQRLPLAVVDRPDWRTKIYSAAVRSSLSAEVGNSL